MRPLNVFIGWDPAETIAYHVLCNSIMRHASGPVSITPLVQASLRQAGLYTRERGETESTEFSLTRFLVPYMSGYGDYSIFMDCDMLCQGDVYELVKIAKKDELRAVWCVKHDYTPRMGIAVAQPGQCGVQDGGYLTHSECDQCRQIVLSAPKFLGRPQTAYPRKNWSSVMVFRNKYCDRLTPAYVNTASGLDLHRMAWAGVEQNIGDLPMEWNWLVGEYAPNAEAKLLHYTIGGPWFWDYRNTTHCDLWFNELDLAFPTINLPKPVGV